MAPASVLAIRLDNPRGCYIPGDRLTGEVVFTSKTSLEVSEVGIELYGTESVRYNSARNENSLFSKTQTLFTGPYTLRADRYTYPFELEFPRSTNPAEEVRQSVFESHSHHTLPPSINHNRPGITYSFDAVIKYELFAYVKRPKWLGSGSKVALESREELTFAPTDPHPHARRTHHQLLQHTQTVNYASQYFPSDEKKPAKEKEEEEVHDQKRPGRFSKLFSSAGKPSSSDPSRPNPDLPSGRVEINFMVPTALHRERHNPLMLYVNHLDKGDFPPVKLRSLTGELKSIVHVPCMQVTVYGAKPGLSEESHVLLSIGEEDESPEIPRGPSAPLELNLFNDPVRQMAEFTGDFTTFNIARAYSLSFQYRFQCGEQTIDLKMTDVHTMIPLASTRPPEPNPTLPAYDP